MHNRKFKHNKVIIYCNKALGITVMIGVLVLLDCSLIMNYKPWITCLLYIHSIHK